MTKECLVFYPSGLKDSMQSSLWANAKIVLG